MTCKTLKRSLITQTFFPNSAPQTISSIVSFTTAGGGRSDDDAQSSSPLADDLFRCPPRSGYTHSYTQGDATYLSLARFHSDPPNIPALRALLLRMRSDARPFPERIFPPILRAFGRAGLPLDALHLFDEMLSCFCCPPSAFSLNSALSSLVCSSSSSPLALPFFNRALRSHPSLSPNLLSFNLVLKSLCSSPSPHLQLALRLFRSIPLRGLRPDSYTYSTLVSALARASRLDDAFALLQEMLLDGIPPNSAAFNPLLSAVLHRGDLRRAANLTRYMLLKGCPPTLPTYNTLVHALCLRGCLHEALSLVTRMLLRDGLSPNEVTHGALVHGLVKFGRLADARLVLDAMRKRGVPANEFVYSALIAGSFRSGDAGGATELWDSMISDGVKPNDVLYTVLVDGLSRLGRAAEAENVVARMSAEGCPPNVRTYSALMWGHFRVGDGQQAIATWEKMVRQGCEPNEVSYSILIDGLCSEGKVREGMAVWKGMISRGLPPDVVAYTAMIRGLCAAGRVDGALRLFHDMRACGDAEPDVVAYNVMFDGLISTGRLIRAVDLLGSMVESECEPDEVTWNIFLKGLGWEEEKGKELMEGMVERMVRKGRLDAAANIVLVMCKKCIAPKTAIWEIVVGVICKMNKVKVMIERIFNKLNAD